jgi:hypothetical protein
VLIFKGIFDIKVGFLRTASTLKSRAYCRTLFLFEVFRFRGSSGLSKRKPNNLARRDSFGGLLRGIGVTAGSGAKGDLSGLVDGLLGPGNCSSG